eukprot:7549692-Pyramimonas_sp.AAC.1
MRCCHFGRKFDHSSRLPSGSCLQVATAYARIPTNLWKCACQITGEPAQRAEHGLDRYGQGASRAEWRNTTTLAIVTARLIDPIDYHQAKISASVAHPSVHARVDKGARDYVQSPKNGPQWGHV